MTMKNMTAGIAFGVLSLVGTYQQELQSAELVVRDIRITTELLPSDFDFSLKNELGNESGSDEFDSGFGFTIGGMYGFTGPGDRSGWLVGGELSYGTYGFGSNGEYVTTGARIFGGYGWQMNDDWYILSELYVGYALAEMKFPTTPAFSSFSADGANTEYGVRLGVGYVINEQWLVSANLGYGFGDASLESGGAQDLELDIEQSGLSFMVGVAYRFSHMPRRLE